MILKVKFDKRIEDGIYFIYFYCYDFGYADGGLCTR